MTRRRKSTTRKHSTRFKTSVHTLKRRRGRRSAGPKKLQSAKQNLNRNSSETTKLN